MWRSSKAGGGDSPAIAVVALAVTVARPLVVIIQTATAAK
jgi:hypothetical protein